MKLYQLTIDTIRVSLLAESLTDARNLIMSEDADFYLDTSKDVQTEDNLSLFIDFGSAFLESTLIELPFKRGIIQSESH